MCPLCVAESERPLQSSARHTSSGCVGGPNLLLHQAAVIRPTGRRPQLDGPDVVRFETWPEGRIDAPDDLCGPSNFAMQSTAFPYQSVRLTALSKWLRAHPRSASAKEEDGAKLSERATGALEAVHRRLYAEARTCTEGSAGSVTRTAVTPRRHKCCRRPHSGPKA